MGAGTKICSYRDLIAWQRAFQLGLEIHRVATSFPSRERFELSSQLRRGAIGVASNIAEGYGRGTTNDYSRFLRMARGTLYELDTQLLFAREFGYLSRQQYTEIKGQLDETERITAGLLRAISRSPVQSS